MEEEEKKKKKEERRERVGKREEEKRVKIFWGKIQIKISLPRESTIMPLS
jgi:hypothetical protein